MISNNIFSHYNRHPAMKKHQTRRQVEFAPNLIRTSSAETKQSLPPYTGIQECALMVCGVRACVRARVCVRTCVRACVHARARVCAYACAYACACACVRGSPVLVVASALAVAISIKKKTHIILMLYYADIHIILVWGNNCNCQDYLMQNRKFKRKNFSHTVRYRSTDGQLGGGGGGGYDSFLSRCSYYPL